MKKKVVLKLFFLLLTVSYIVSCGGPSSILDSLDNLQNFDVHNKTGYDNVHVEVYIDDPNYHSHKFSINNNEKKTLGQCLPQYDIKVNATATTIDNNGKEVFLYNKTGEYHINTYELRKRGWDVYLNPSGILITYGPML